MRSERRQREPIPAEPAGRTVLPRAARRPRASRRHDPLEIAAAEPDARFDDPRLPDSSAREQPDGAPRRSRQGNGYRNTDERF